MFTYPPSLISEIRKKWLKIKHDPKDKVPLLPPQAIIEELLQVAYHASLLTEEKRRLEFRIAFYPKTKYLVHRDCKHDHPKKIAIEFENPVLFSLAEILKLAPATNLKNGILCVEQAKGPTKQIQIWGILNAGSSWWKLVHSEARGGSPPPDALTVSSTEPGNLTISREGLILLSLRHGQICYPTSNIFNLDRLSNFFGPAVTEFQNQLEKITGETISAKFAKSRYIELIERLLFQVRQKSHGGLIVMVPNELEATDQRLLERALIKFPSVYREVWNELIRYNSRLIQHSKFLGKKGKQQSRICRDIVGHGYYLDKLARDSQESLSDNLEFLASLTGIDGAVILTNQFRLLGFGCEVIVPSNIRIVKVVQSSNKQLFVTDSSIESFGTRHRSAFRLCSNYEEAIAFVISQDGGVKLIKRIGPNLFMWPDINEGYLGI